MLISDNEYTFIFPNSVKNEAVVHRLCTCNGVVHTVLVLRQVFNRMDGLTLALAMSDVRIRHEYTEESPYGKVNYSHTYDLMEFCTKYRDYPNDNVQEFLKEFNFFP